MASIPQTKRPVQVITGDDLRRQLAQFEARYGLPTSEFLRRWRSGGLPERMAYRRWFGLCHLAQRTGLLTWPDPRADPG